MSSTPATCSSGSRAVVTATQRLRLKCGDAATGVVSRWSVVGIQLRRVGRQPRDRRAVVPRRTAARRRVGERGLGAPVVRQRTRTLFYQRREDDGRRGATRPGLPAGAAACPLLGRRLSLCPEPPVVRRHARRSAVPDDPREHGLAGGLRRELVCRVAGEGEAVRTLGGPTYFRCC